MAEKTTKRTPATRKQAPRKKRTTSKTKVAVVPKWVSRLPRKVQPFATRKAALTQAFLKRRPHRSFKRTRRIDYKRSMKIPGYIAFTHQVNTLLWRNKKLFVSVMLIFSVANVALTGLLSEETYTEIKNMSSSLAGNLDEVPSLLRVGYGIGLTVLATASGSSGRDTSDIQKSLIGLTAVLTWLVTVWIVRMLVAGKKPRLRDALYNAGAPLISTFSVLGIVLIQLIPTALALMAISAILSTGIVTQGFPLMLISILAAAIITLTLYWLAASMIALVIVTLPGMYPWQAIRTASDLVVGRRLRLLLRLIWMIAIIALTWYFIVGSIILFDDWIKGIWEQIAVIPIVSLSALLVGSYMVVWAAIYVYLLYRKIMEDNAKPA